MEIGELFEAYWKANKKSQWKRRLELRTAVREAAGRPVTVDALVRLIDHIGRRSWYPLSVEDVLRLIRTHRGEAAVAEAAHAAAGRLRSSVDWFADALESALAGDDTPFTRSWEGVVLDLYDEVSCRFLLPGRSVHPLIREACDLLDEARRITAAPPPERAAALVALYPSRVHGTLEWWHANSFNRVLEALQRDPAVTLDAEQIVSVADAMARRDLTPLFEPSDFVRLLERSAPGASVEACDAIRRIAGCFDSKGPLSKRLLALADGRILTKTKPKEAAIREAFAGGWIRLPSKGVQAKSAEWRALAACIARSLDSAADPDYEDDALTWPLRATGPLVKELHARMGGARVVTLGCLETPALVWVIDTRDDRFDALVEWLAIHIYGSSQGAAWEQADGLCYAGEEIGLDDGLVRTYPGVALVAAFGRKLAKLEDFLAKHPPSELLAA